MNERENVKSFAAKLFCIGFFAICFYFVFKYGIGAILPFVVAYAVSLIITPMAHKTAQKTKIPKKICAAIYVSFVLGIIVTLATVGISRLFREARELLSSGEGGFGGVMSLIDTIKRPFEFVFMKLGGGNTSDFDKIMTHFESKMLELTTKLLTDMLSGIVSKAPSIFIGIAVTVMSCYYFCMDGTAIRRGIKKALPQKYRDNVTRTVSLSVIAIKKYAKAYLFLMLITFVEIFVGLSILKVKYSLLLALVISAVDILPVLGVGSVLIPWAVAVLFMGDTSLGLGLLILYGVITIVRQIIEPHIVGSTIGLHPIASLFSTYAGLRLFGIFGMIAGPAIAFIILEMMKREE